MFVSSPNANAISVLDFDGNLVATIGNEAGASSPVGAHTIVAAYSGDSIHTPSTSSALTQTITKK